MAERYPDGMHGAIAAGITELLRRLRRGQHGYSRSARARSDRGSLSGDRCAHLVGTCDARQTLMTQSSIGYTSSVLGGMGLLALHSAPLLEDLPPTDGHHLLAGLAQLRRHRTGLDGQPVPPDHRRVPHPIVINEHEMYGEFFDIPAPDELIFLSTFSGGEVFRSGCCWRRGKGKVFYFSPGDQEYPIYHHPDIKRVLANAVLWAQPEQSSDFAPPAVVNMPAPHFDRGALPEGIEA